MKHLAYLNSVFIAVILLFFCVSLQTYLYAQTINVYPGAENTFFDIVKTVKPGDTVLFHDGTYIERNRIEITTVGGTKEKPIVFKSANPQGAKIVFDLGKSWGRIYVTVPYINIEDFEITQIKKANPTPNDPNPTWNHILTFYKDLTEGAPEDKGGHHCRVRGNVIHNGYEEAIKTHLVNDIIIENNYIYDFTHDGIDCTPANSSIIRNNHLYNIGRVHILVKYLDPKDNLIYGNYIHNDTVQMTGGGYGIVLGGSSPPGSPVQARNSVAFNNIIVSESPGLIERPLAIISGIDCGFYNNVVIGTKHGMFTLQTDTVVVNPTFKNNIFYNIQDEVALFSGIGSGLTTDHNLYYNAPNPPLEERGIYDVDPQFIDPMRDWHVRDSSPVIDAGTQWSFKTLAGEIIDVAFDFANEVRTGPWDIGAYEFKRPSIPANRCVDEELLTSINEEILNEQILQVAGQNIQYSLSSPSHVQIKIYNTMGQFVKELVNEKHAEGVYKIAYGNENLPKGIYLCLMMIENDHIAKKFLVH
ncbi:right-handed parallel beta-helix repeat-containing protein [Flagellimonas meishanensis]|uniref:right-handed parallel beta-helix repeat-containing protein n=1 Tax=Flagellimonas meishanensis TaxID=2873264 RepID=UPI001CA7309B|nr:right-handed parallel beta-helix repeat-containing protein [[Muricauda] meishanensis]